MASNTPVVPSTLPSLQQTLSPSTRNTIEALKLKSESLKQSIQVLINTLCTPAPPPAWPDILSKYSVVLSQSYSFSTSLLDNSDLPNLALHPSSGLTDTQLDNELIPLLRNQQTMDVLRIENATVRRIAERMRTRGALGPSNPNGQNGVAGSLGAGSNIQYSEVLQECREIRDEHDAKIARGAQALSALMQQEDYDWKARLAVETEEPEEIDWQMDGMDDAGGASKAIPVMDEGDSDNDEEETEVALRTGANGTPESVQDATPAMTG